MTYTGGKNGSGVYQKIISMMPPHSAYFELFLGHGAILRNKKPAKENIGVEIDKSLQEFWKEKSAINNSDEMPEININFDDTTDRINIIFDDVFNFLASRTFAPDNLIYLDPPYLLSTRRTKGKLYNYEMMSESEHIRLLEIITKLNCMVMISGYDSELYNKYLKSWRKESFTTTDRANNLRTEIVWLNFPNPMELHDYSFLGANWRERDRIKQKRKRWRNRLQKLDEQEMFALMATIEDLKKEKTKLAS